jgi:hypothetical protein
MAIYTGTFSGVAVTLAQDVFEITAPATASVLIHDVKLGQYTDFGDAAAEILSVTVVRGYTVAGTGGSTVTPRALKSFSPAVSSTVLANNTTVANTGTASVLVADAFNIAAGWSLRDAVSLPNSSSEVGMASQGIWLDAGERLVVRITAPADSLTMNGTLVFEELPKRILS